MDLAYHPSEQDAFPREVSNGATTVEIKPISKFPAGEDTGKTENASTVEGKLKPPDLKVFSLDTNKSEMANPAQTSLLDLDQNADTPDPIDWEKLSEESKIVKISDTLRLAGMPEEQIQIVSDAVTEAQKVLAKELPPSSDEDQTRPEINKSKLSAKQLAGGTVLLMLGSIVDRRGTAHMVESLLNQYIHDSYINPFMEKLGFDPELLKEVSDRRFDLGRNLFQWDRPQLLAFLSGISKADAFDLMESLDEEERKELIETGTFSGAKSDLSKAEVKRYLLDRLTDGQRSKLHIA